MEATTTDHNKAVSSCTTSTSRVAANMMRRTLSVGSHGSHNNNNVEEKLADFDRVLESISPSDKQAYVQAQQRCPHLVELESPPMMFLRRHEFHVWNAATALIGYWEVRWQMFGPERAFLPLDLTGHGALEEEDIAAFAKGFTMLLPEHAQTGAPVIMCCAQYAPDIAQDVIARTFFMIRNVAALNPLAQTLGYFGIIRYSSAWRQMVAQQGIRMGMDALEYIPVQVRHLIMIAQPDEFEVARAHMQTMAAQNPIFAKMHLVADYGDEDLMQKLEAQGFSRQGLPHCIKGGQLTLEQITEGWMQKFQRGLGVEDYCVSHNNRTDTTTTTTTTTTQQPTPSVVSQQLASKPPPPLSSNNNNKAEWGFKVLEETIHFMADNDEKAAYLEAIETAPELVQFESNPQHFLHSVDYDGWAAAQRLCKYWYFRKKWFGPTRAFRPMTMNSNNRQGALSTEDCQMIQKGIFQILPPDTHGRAVLTLRSTGTPKGGSILRALFYFIQKLSEQETSRTTGTVLLIHLVGSVGYIDGNKWTEAFDFVWNATAVKHQKVVLLGYEGSVSMSRGQALKQVFKSDAELVELVENPTENLQRMLAVGFTQEGIPTDLGGLRTPQDFHSWVDHQLALEDK
eukprot:scaffold35825_cov183-Amphora_coffeaeformis.AAC.1